jgi:hypothetical protein
MMKFALLAIGIGLIALTVLSRVRSARWWIRSADFPRLQVFAVLVELQLEPAVAADQAAPEPDQHDLEDARERIAEGRAAE